MGSEPVFADSAFLYALIDLRDSAHAGAVECMNSLTRENRGMVTTDHVVAETLTLTKGRCGSSIAVRLLDRIESSALIRLEWVGPDRFHAAKAFFRKHADHGYSFTDCTSFVVMRELGLKDALTTDRHFAEAGFKVLLKTG